jgi:hypothetical protein
MEAVVTGANLLDGAMEVIAAGTELDGVLMIARLLWNKQKI